MVIHVAPSKLHWNYFLALERDMEVVTRFIEFRQENFAVFSIELAHLLFAAASEVDVVAKLLCKQVAPQSLCRNINEYRRVLSPRMPELPHEKVFVPRYGLDFEPWSNWANGKNPIAIIVPCYRVIRTDGTLGGYAGGLDVKEFLLLDEMFKLEHRQRLAEIEALRFVAVQRF